MIKRLPKFLLYPLAAVLPALGLMMGLGTAAQASTASSHATASAPSAAATAAAKAAIKHLLIGQHGTDHRVTSVQKKAGVKAQAFSSNWSGYVDTGSNFSEVNASWTEPSVSCGSQTQLAAFWVGIDGFSSSTVEQDGTLIECFGGSAFQFSWWEMFPTNAIQVVGGSVQPGDQIFSSVVRSGTNYILTLSDTTHPANSFTTVQGCSGCANSSAEWIGEAPSGSGGIFPLPDFGSWTPTNLSVAGSVTGTTDIIMIGNAGNIKAEPGPLNGNSFTDFWESSI